VVIQEIFGVNDYIKGACERLATLGYVALAPDLDWRLGPGIAIDEKGPGGLGKAVELLPVRRLPEAPRALRGRPPVLIGLYIRLSTKPAGLLCITIRPTRSHFPRCKVGSRYGNYGPPAGIRVSLKPP
jgi:hypothetical protein